MITSVIIRRIFWFRFQNGNERKRYGSTESGMDLKMDIIIIIIKQSEKKQRVKKKENTEIEKKPFSFVFP